MGRDTATVGNISKAIAIFGWMDEDELAWLAEQAATHSRIVEVGSFLGRSTRALADNTAGVVYALDNWLGPMEVDLPTEVRKELLPNFKANLADHIATGRVIPIVSDHSLPPRGIAPDMVFVDGDHSMESAYHDISYWASQLDAGGLLCGHDYDHAPVAAAVHSLFDRERISVTNKIWSVNV